MIGNVVFQRIKIAQVNNKVVILVTKGKNKSAVKDLNTELLVIGAGNIGIAASHGIKVMGPKIEVCLVACGQAMDLNVRTLDGYVFVSQVTRAA